MSAYGKLCYFTLEWLRKHSASTCTPNFRTKAALDEGASMSKFEVHCHGGVVCPSCMHTACNGTYFVRKAAVHTTSKKQKYGIRKTPVVYLGIILCLHIHCLRSYRA